MILLPMSYLAFTGTIIYFSTSSAVQHGASLNNPIRQTALGFQQKPIFAMCLTSLYFLSKQEQMMRFRKNPHRCQNINFGAIRAPIPPLLNFLWVLGQVLAAFDRINDYFGSGNGGRAMIKVDISNCLRYCWVHCVWFSRDERGFILSDESRVIRRLQSGIWPVTLIYFPNRDWASSFFIRFIRSF